MTKPRARDIGIPFDGKPGQYNAITDIPGVTVGFTTLIRGNATLTDLNQEPVIRTGVTAIRPRGENPDPVYAAWYSLNGCGEMTGTSWVEESGFLYGPVMLTNTFSVGVVHQATIDWVLRSYPVPFGLPVVTETYDGFLNHIRGFHIQPEHISHSLDSAKSGLLLEGNVGGGTGMICYDFKGGTGSSSRQVEIGSRTFTIGSLVQANHGSRHQLMIAGVPIGKEITELMPHRPPPTQQTRNSSIVVIIATDLPLLPHQLKRLARRVPLGLARTGAVSEYSSGDIFLAFSTSEAGPEDENGIRSQLVFNDWKMDPFYEALEQSVEESIINTLIAAETMEGVNQNKVYALPKDRLRGILKKYNRLIF